jgi:uncharacterized protein YjiS (DUF1127 family)
MTTLTIGTHEGVSSPFVHFSRALGVAHAVFNRRAQRRVMRSLLELDDHLLADIGLTRAEVEQSIASVEDAFGTRFARLRAAKAGAVRGWPGR